jgi:adenine-specific DNA-methyltransferase
VIQHKLHAGSIWVGDWMEAPLEPGYTLAIVDGPYAMGKAAWDRMGVEGLADWYAPHIARVSALLAPSASVYLWNTAEGWARLDPVMRAAGWTFRGLVTWEKTNPPSQKGCEDARSWPDATEVAGFYQREKWAPSTCAGSAIGYAAGRDERNPARAFLCDEWAAAGLRSKDADRAMGTNGMAGHYFGASQWSLPTWAAYQALAAFAQEHGPARGRPYLVLPSCWPEGGLRASYDHLRASYDHLRAEYDHLRAEYEASRPAFTLPPGVTNVWSAPIVGGGERLAGPAGTALHPCQKPLLFAERMIRASTRPGERVLVPFGGTCREAVVCEWLARTTPAEARGYDVCELNADGVDYIGPVLAQIRGEDTRPRAAGQMGLFR